MVIYLIFIKQLDLCCQPFNVLYSSKVIMTSQEKFNLKQTYQRLFKRLIEEKYYFKGSTSIIFQNILFSLGMIFCHPTELDKNLSLRFLLSRLI